jgi:hypothetical protein
LFVRQNRSAKYTPQVKPLLFATITLTTLRTMKNSDAKKSRFPKQLNTLTPNTPARKNGEQK